MHETNNKDAMEFYNTLSGKRDKPAFPNKITCVYCGENMLIHHSNLTGYYYQCESESCKARTPMNQSKLECLKKAVSVRRK